MIRAKKLLPVAVLAILACCACQKKGAGPQMAGTIPQKIDFNFHVRPILSDRCYACHGPDENKREADLRLDLESSAFAALASDSNHFAIVKGDPEASALVQRIRHEDPEERMPPKSSHLSLSEQEIEILTKWIEQGAEWKKHWAFSPPEKPVLPEVKNKDWPKNEIDQFVMARLEQAGIQPAETAPKEKLLRRVYFDLTGLPPSMEEIDAFLNDSSEQAYEKLIDRLLASEAFGERMAVDWLDAARYADSHGYQDDLERTMWPWRNWVIQAYNDNMPFNTFATWQLAGDLLPEADLPHKIASAFHRNHMITQEGGVIDEEYRVEYVADRTQTTAKVFMGLTMECARCHDHKYDPISQKEYYQLFSFFNNVPERGKMRAYGVTPEPFIKITQKEVDEKLDFLHGYQLKDTMEMMVMQELDSSRACYILKRGAYDAHGEQVYAETPSVLGLMPEDLPRNRLGLAQWLFQEDHPLTARTTVNRFWQMYFGTGLVKTADDFGNQGELPSHPALLDWLATRFIDSGWDIKAMQKYIVMSATYQQDSHLRPELQKIDPENRLLARGPRFRLPAEMIRDQALAASELLVQKIGGPSVKPYQPEGLWEETTGGGGGSLASYIEGEGDDLYRRSLYSFWKRTIPPPSMLTMDAARRSLCTIKRQATSTPLQALVLMNDPQYLEAAKVLASNMCQDPSQSIEEGIQQVFRRFTGRWPQESETKLLNQYFQTELARLAQDETSVESLLNIGKKSLSNMDQATETAAFMLLISSIMNLDETVSKS